MKTHVVIFNRRALTAADGWIHIVPKGELPNREAGIVQVLDEPSLDSILAGITSDRERLGEKWPGIYAGREHFIYHPDQDSAALGWFKEFQKREDGIWAKDDGLTNLGNEAIKNRLYKFTSFVADRGDLEKIEGDAADGLPRYRVMRIETVGFTNQANGKELLVPITNRENLPGKNEAAKPADAQNANVAPASRGSGREFRPAGDEGAGAPATTENDFRLQLIDLLHLPATADDETILDEIRRLREQGDSLTSENQSLLTEQVEAILADHHLIDPKVVNRLRPVLLPLANRAERVAFLAELGLKPGAKAARPARVLNRGGSQAVAAHARAGTDDEQTLARKIQNRASELQATGLKFDTAWKQAQRELAAK